jgi:hypothetical protein
VTQPCPVGEEKTKALGPDQGQQDAREFALDLVVGEEVFYGQIDPDAPAEK